MSYESTRAFGEVNGSNNYRRKSRRLILTSMSVVGVVGSLAVVATSAGAVPDTKVTICHATAANGNPYTTNTIDTSSVDASGAGYLNGHGGPSHDGPIWDPAGGAGQPTWGDIIPVFTNPNPPGSTFPGRNATGAVAAILLANNCNYVAPTGSPTATATATVTATATATATATVTASPTTTSTVIVTPPPVVVTPPPVVVTAPPVTVTNTQVVTVTASATPVATATSSPVAIALPAAADTAAPSQAPQIAVLPEAGSAPSVIPAGGDGAASRSQGSLVLAGALGLMGIAGMTGLALTGKRRDSE